jgi:hypothetical protein
MSTTTTRNSLVKPGYADASDIAVINTNYDTIDASFAKCNWAGSAAPTVNDDFATDGYSIGSVWFDTTNNNLYVAKSVATGAAVWVKQAAHNNYSATTAPGVNDDLDLHYAPGSVWLDTTNNNLYVCKSAANGAAVWVKRAAHNNYSATAAPTANDDLDLHYAPGSVWLDTTNHAVYVCKSAADGAAVWYLRAGHNNYAAGAAPTVNDDIDLYYAPGSTWIDTTNHDVYMCESAANGAAVWKKVNSAVAAGVLLADGTVPLTANWDAGAFKITANQVESDVAYGTAPLVVASATAVTNLNADLLDGNHSSAFVTQALADAKGDLIVASAADTWAREAVSTTDGYSLVSDASASNGVSWQPMYAGQARNLLINGGFTVNQSAITQITSATAIVNNDDTYVTDQWILLSDGNDVMDVWPDAATGPVGKAGSVLLQTETANKKAGILQILEYKNCRPAIGDAVSLRFSAYTTAANPNANIMAGVISWSSTADSVTSDVVSAWNAAGAAPTLVANWTFENTPSQLALVNDTWTEYKIENISIDTASTTNLGVFIWLDDTNSTVDDRLYISSVQLNKGPTCLPWVGKEYGAELNSCRRYFTVYNASASAYGHFTQATAQDTQYGYSSDTHPTLFFATSAAVTMVGSWQIGSLSIESMTTECTLNKIIVKCAEDGKGLTAGHSYLTFAANDTTARVYIASRL